jgi:hypothetical protein
MSSPLRSAFRVCLPTLLTAYSRCNRAGSFSHRQRSWDFPFEAFPWNPVATLFGVAEPTYRWPDRYFPAAAGAGSTGVGFWALTHGPSPWLPRALLTPATAGCSPGLPAFSGMEHKPGQNLRSASPRTLSGARMGLAAFQGLDQPVPTLNPCPDRPGRSSDPV